MSTRALSSFELLGSSLNCAPIEALEQLALTSGEVKTLYTKLRNIAGLDGAFILSTCNRTEVYFSSNGPGELASQVWDALRALIGAKRIPMPNNRYSFSGRQGMDHLYRVSCGLDSVVLGEAQILGQVKAAYEDSRAHFHSTYFDKIVQGAFRVASRSRTETEIGAGAVSTASAGVHLAGRVFSDFATRTVVVVGAGETGRLVAEHFARKSPNKLIILNRTFETAKELAGKLGAVAWPISKLNDALLEADVLATAVKVANPIITGASVEEVMRQRTSRTLAVLDLGLPRNVSIQVNDIVNVFLSDIGDLRQVVDANLKRRRREIPKVEDFIHEELDRLVAWQRSFQAGPLIGALRQGVEEVRIAEVGKVTARLSEAETLAVERATRAVVNKILHGPMAAIHQYARQAEEGAEGLEVIRDMFGNLTHASNTLESEDNLDKGPEDL